ncbi:phosphatidylserine decarboxylase family protein [bacterium]|nr:phosphatidylserine decarboxylase family protein [bacterium]
MDKDGFKFFLVLLILSIIALVLSRYWGIAMLIVALVFLLGSSFIMFFFRDPSRKVPEGDDVLVSPADGRIVEIKDAEDSFVGEGKHVAIFMSPFNVHINRVPFSAKVIDIKSRNGKFLPAYKTESEFENARVEVSFRSAQGFGILVRQIAGVFARRIVCRLKKGMDVMTGQKMGLIRFGSRVEVVFPSDFRVAVKIGQKVIGGVTIIAELKR